LATAFSIHRARARPANPEAVVLPAKPAEPAAGTIRAEGRVVTYPNAEVVVSSEVQGRIKVLVAEHAFVHKGDVIAELDQSEAWAAVAEAQARVELAKLSAGFENNEFKRASEPGSSQTIARALVDRAEYDSKASLARLAVEKASLVRLSLLAGKQRIRAPLDGTVTARFAQVGEMVGSSKELVTIVDTKRVRVEAEVDEFDAGNVVVGQAATIEAEGFRGQKWSGLVELVPPNVVSRGLKPQDPGRPSDTRVLLVKISLIGTTPLKVGQRVEVKFENAG
jgi:RND family efflux transporter MFP subunit